MIIFQKVDITTYYAHLIANLILYLYKTEILQNLMKKKNIKDAKSFNLTYRYIDDVLSINNPSFCKWLPSMYQSKIEIKETTETACSASF